VEDDPVWLLVVEDETRMAALLRRGLQEEGYAVDVAADGVQALWQAGEYDHDAIVLDGMLPGLDGFEVCRRIRARGLWAPVLLLTARDGIENRVRGLDAGADDYLVKPFAFAELTARLRAVLRRGRQQRPTVLVWGPRTGAGDPDGAAPAGAASSRARRALLRCWGSGQAEAAVVAGRSDGEGELGERGGHAVAPSYFGREFVAAAPQVLNERMPGRDDPGADSS
jgi:CheY-like chemotaxis protein